MFDKRKENGQQNAVPCPIRFSLYAEDMSQCCTVWRTPDTVLNYLWSMTNAQANCKYASATIVVEAYATHRIICADSFLYLCGAVLDSKRPGQVYLPSVL